MILPYKSILPEIDESVFIAGGAVITGDVKIGKDSSIWFNSVIRGDVHYVRIGERTNIQDGSILHVTNGRFPLNIGDDVTVGHNAIVHGCTVKSNVLIGMGAILLDDSVINSNSLIAAGTVVREGFEIPEGVLAAGVPAKVIRNLTSDEIIKIKESAAGYVKYAEEYKKILNAQ